MVELRLAKFVESLLFTGELSVGNRVVQYTPEDLAQTEIILHRFHQLDSLRMPAVAPAFSRSAAAWGAQYMHHSIQLIFLRHIGSEEITQILQPFSEPKTPETIYSGDLCLRFIHGVFGIAKDFSLDDPLVKSLLELAHQWPFSSVGIPVENTDESIIFSSASLKIAYADRIINAKATDRLKNQEVQEQIKVAMGNFSKDFWPAFEMY